MAVDRIQDISGAGKEAVANRQAETRDEVEVFPDPKHLSSWAGMSPGSKEMQVGKSQPESHLE